VAGIFSPFVAFTSYYTAGGKGLRIPMDVALEVAQNQLVRIVRDHDERGRGGQGAREEGRESGART
jgi:hypothetical protein